MLVGSARHGGGVFFFVLHIPSSYLFVLLEPAMSRLEGIPVVEVVPAVLVIIGQIGLIAGLIYWLIRDWYNY